MFRDNPIGKRVFRIVEKNYGFVPEEKKTFYKVEQVIESKGTLPDGTTNNNWYDVYVIRPEKGGEAITLPYYEAIFAPDDSRPLDEKIYMYLRDNGIYSDVYLGHPLSSDSVNVSITWGDWKHEHGYCECLMRYIGYEEFHSEVTEENGSDCYSAVHYYLPKGYPILTAIKAFRDAQRKASNL